MKKAAPILLLLILLFQSAGYLIVFKVQQTLIRHEIKQQIKAGIPESEQVLLIISHATQQNREVFQRIHSREFRYHGKMYDVIKREEKNGTTWFYCIGDEQETRLFARLDEQVRKEMQTPASEKQREKLQQWVNPLFFNENPKNSLTTDPSCLMHTPHYSFSVKMWQSPPETQPPRV